MDDIATYDLNPCWDASFDWSAPIPFYPFLADNTVLLTPDDPMFGAVLVVEGDWIPVPDEDGVVTHWVRAEA
jgi:hypothetical protein